MDIFEENSPIKLARVSEFKSPIYDYLTLFEVDAVIDHILKILSCPKGTYVFDPEFGSDLLTYVFQPLDELTITSIKKEVERVIKSHSRISTFSVIVTPNITANKVDIDITLTFSTGQTRNVGLVVNRNAQSISVLGV